MLKFLQVLRSIRCRKCIRTRVRACWGLPNRMSEKREIILESCCAGLHFREEELQRSIFHVDFKDIKKFDLREDHLYLETLKNNKKIQIAIEGKRKEEIFDSINHHKKESGCDDAITSSESPFISFPTLLTRNFFRGNRHNLTPINARSMPSNLNVFHICVDPVRWDEDQPSKQESMEHKIQGMHACLILKKFFRYD